MLRTMRAVWWSFLGLRRGADYREDAEHLNPVHVVVAALVATAIFIGVLVMLAKWAVRWAS